VVLLSATSGFNKKVLLNEVSTMIERIMGKGFVTLEYPAWDHDRRVKWLLNYAKISDPTNFTVDEEGEFI
jgi:hypothetical protein